VCALWPVNRRRRGGHHRQLAALVRLPALRPLLGRLAQQATLAALFPELHYTAPVMRQTASALRLACLLTLFTEASCAGDFVNHRFDFPGANTARLEVRDASGAVIRNITDRPTIQAFDAAVDRIDSERRPSLPRSLSSGGVPL
jgi:hypothetical protein